MSVDVQAVIVAGVSGSGKSTVGRGLADRLGWPYVEADDHHPPANVTKMARGEPLDDDDRAPWLASLRSELDRHAKDGVPVVLSCSALKRRYRQVLTDGLPHVAVVLLHGSIDLLTQRMAQRTGHFFGPGLLRSQLEALELPGPEEPVLAIDVDAPPDVLVARIADQLKLVPTASRSEPEAQGGSTP